MSERVTVAIADGVADVRLSRPDKMNALDDAMFTGLIEMGDRLAEDTSVRAVVISGEGRAFCAGLDVASFGAMAGAGAPDRPESGDDRRSGARETAGRLLAKKHDSPANRAQRTA